MKKFFQTTKLSTTDGPKVISVASPGTFKYKPPVPLHLFLFNRLSAPSILATAAACSLLVEHTEHVAFVALDYGEFPKVAELSYSFAKSIWNASGQAHLVRVYLMNPLECNATAVRSVAGELRDSGHRLTAVWSPQQAAQWQAAVDKVQFGPVCPTRVLKRLDGLFAEDLWNSSNLASELCALAEAAANGSFGGNLAMTAKRVASCEHGSYFWSDNGDAVRRLPSLRTLPDLALDLASEPDEQELSLAAQAICALVECDVNYEQLREFCEAVARTPRQCVQ